MLYMLDSDVARKLAQYGLIDELAEALEINLSEFAILPQLKYQLHIKAPDKSRKKLGSASAYNAAKRLIEEATEVVVDLSKANLILELNRADIDDGEQVLFAVLIEQVEQRLITGDKRALVAISKIDSIQNPHLVWGRILCLEEAIYILVIKHDFSNISSKITSRPDVDISLSNIFGRSAPANVEGVLAGLQSYMGDLHKKTRGFYIMNK